MEYFCMKIGVFRVDFFLEFSDFDFFCNSGGGSLYTFRMYMYTKIDPLQDNNKLKTKSDRNST